MSRLFRLAALACLASVALAMSVRVVRAEQPPAREPPSPARPGAAAPLEGAPLDSPGPVQPPAQAPIVTMPPLTRLETEHYWYLLMLADVTWLWAGIRFEEENLAYVAYPALAPAVHLVMNGGGTALKSAALRLGASGFAYLYLARADSEDRKALLTGGAFLGAAALFDWFYFGRRPRTVLVPAHERKSSTWTWTPGLLAGEHGWQLGVSGAF